MKKVRSSKIYIADIIQSIDRISEYLEGYSFEDFFHDQKTIDAVVRNFEIIGEASKSVSIDIKEKYPELPWKEMYLMRNIVSHEYFGIDYSIIWDVSMNHLPENKLQLVEIFKNEF